MDRDPPELAAAQAEIEGLQQQLVAVTEHRSRVMVLLTERSREIADLTTELGRAKAEALRYLEDAQSATRQLRRTNEKLAEIAQNRLSTEQVQHRLADELESTRLELTATKTRANDLEKELRSTQSELAKLHQEVDAAKRTLEAQAGAWEQERQQLAMTVTGLTLEIQSEHQAARVLEKRWVLAPVHSATKLNRSTETGAVDLRVARAEAVEAELNQLHQERAQLSARLRDLERDAGASRELSRLQQELRSALVEKNLLERRLEDSEARDREREELRAKITDLQQNRLDADLARAEVERLRLRLYKAPLSSGAYAMRPESYLGDLQPLNGDLDGELQNLAIHSLARSAVVADDRGFAIASLNGTDESDVVAALAGEAERFSKQARQFLGLSEITQFTLQDRNGTVAHYRFFAIGEDVMSVAVIGSTVPDEGLIDRVISAMIQQLTDPRERAARILKSGS